MIFYFSATGNSKYAARRLAEKLCDTCVDLAEALKKGETSFKLSPGETVGFVIPTYYYGIPVIMHSFLYALQFITKEMHYTYLVLTCGGNTGCAGESFKTLLADNNYKLSAYFSVVMPDNYLVLYSPPPHDKINRILRSADTELDTICTDINLRMTGNCDRHRGFLPELMSRMVYPIYKKGRKTEKFHATSSCISCGLCEGICPCEAIKVENGQPRWVEEECVYCFACINRCPTAAIQRGRVTEKRGRYVNPEIE